jgi:hypothetical protein
MFYLMDISLSYYAQPLQQLLPDQDFWPTVAIRHDWSRGAAAHSGICWIAEKP